MKVRFFLFGLFLVKVGFKTPGDARLFRPNVRASAVLPYLRYEILMV